MTDQAAKELKQIKIQDQIRDIKSQLATTRRKRRNHIGYVLQLFVLLLVVIFIPNFPILVNFIMGKLDFALFDLSPLLLCIILIIILVIVFLIYRVFKLSNQIVKIENEIIKREQALKKLQSET